MGVNPGYRPAAAPERRPVQFPGAASSSFARALVMSNRQRSRQGRGDRALAQAVILAIGVAELDPEPLGFAQLRLLLFRPLLQGLPIGLVEPLVPFGGRVREAFHHVEGAAVAFRIGDVRLLLRMRRQRATRTMKRRTGLCMSASPYDAAPRQSVQRPRYLFLITKGPRRTAGLRSDFTNSSVPRFVRPARPF